MNLHCFGANLPWQLLTFSILQQHTSAAASSTLHIIYVFHTISSSSYLTLEGTPLKLVYFFGYPFSTRATLLSSSGHISAFLSLNLMYRYLKRAFKKFKDPIQEISSSSLLTFFLFCLTFSESSLASTHSLTSPWHQVPDFYELPILIMLIFGRYHLVAARQE